ncbi:MAG: glycosyltransferase family 9 protein [Terriglobales bacterium]
MNAPRRILLIHFGQLGDAVLALPAARALCARFPRARMTVLCARGSDEIFRMGGLGAGGGDIWAVDRVLWKRQPWRAAVAVPWLLLRLRFQRFHLSVDLHSYKETNWLAFLAGIPERVAMLRPTRSIPSLINRKPPPDDPAGRLLDRYCQVLQPLGIQLAAADRIPTLTPPPPPQGLGDGDRPMLGICPGAGHPSRRWPPDRFAAVAQVWLARGARVLVFAGPEEDAAVMAPLAAVPSLEIFRHLSLPELAGALARCRVVLTNPTGPSHITAAVGARVLTLGEIPAFDPVPVPPGAVVALRAQGAISSISVPVVLAALEQLWQGDREGGSRKW